MRPRCMYNLQVEADSRMKKSPPHKAMSWNPETNYVQFLLRTRADQSRPPAPPSIRDVCTRADRHTPHLVYAVLGAALSELVRKPTVAI